MSKPSLFLPRIKLLVKAELEFVKVQEDFWVKVKATEIQKTPFHALLDFNTIISLSWRYGLNAAGYCVGAMTIMLGINSITDE